MAAMIEMSAKEIQDFWHGFCERQKVSPQLRAEGDKEIAADPEFWADHTMWDLLEKLKAKG
jgi:hypothetical protein